MEELITSTNTLPKGKLNILLPLEFFNQIIGSLITDFAIQYPEITVNCQHYSEHYPELDHQYDLVFVLHETNLPASNWIGRTLLSFPQAIYSNAEDLPELIDVADVCNKHAVVANISEEWHFRAEDNVITVPPKVALVLSSPEMRVTAAQRQLGLVKLPNYVGDNSEGLIAVPLSHQITAQQLTVLYQSRNIPMKTRIFLDYFQSNIGYLS